MKHQVWIVRSANCFEWFNITYYNTWINTLLSDWLLTNLHLNFFSFSPSLGFLHMKESVSRADMYLSILEFLKYHIYYETVKCQNKIGFSVVIIPELVDGVVWFLLQVAIRTTTNQRRVPVPVNQWERTMRSYSQFNYFLTNIHNWTKITKILIQHNILLWFTLNIQQ